MTGKKQELKDAISTGKILIAVGVILAFIAAYTDFFIDLAIWICSMINIIYGSLLWLSTSSSLEKLEAEEKLKKELSDTKIIISIEKVKETEETEEEDTNLNTKE